MNSNETITTKFQPRPPRVERQDKFLFEQSKEGEARFNIVQKADFEMLAKEVGRQILASWKENVPVKGLNLYGCTKIGKTEFSNLVFSQFEGSENLALKTTKMERIESTFPKCAHVDYWQCNGLHRLMYLNFSPADDELLITEWSELTPKKYFYDDRIEIELLRYVNSEDITKKYSQMKLPLSIFSFRPFQSRIKEKFVFFAATLIGHGKGLKIVESLKANDSFKNIIF